MNSESEQFSDKGRDIRDDLYECRGTPLTKEEAASLNPILNTLKNHESRYDAPLFMAEGGEKRIYKVYDRHLNRFVAMAKASKAATARNYEQFLREGQLTANLTHPNIVHIYNVGIDSEGAPFFSMELIPGDSLKDIIRELKENNPAYKTKYPLETLLSIFSKVCDAVSYAHSREVLHLDIKPDNIRVGEFGEVFLCDWGLARVIHAEENETPPGGLDADILNDMTLSGTVKGTPGFMAPEQTVSQGDKTPQTDIYALGALLYNMLTHEIPVLGNNAKEVMKNTRTGKVIPPRRRRPGRKTSKGLAAVAIKALSFKPGNRYASAQGLQEEIHLYQTGFPTRAEQAGPMARLNLLTQRHRRLTFWFMTFLVLLTLVMSINLSIIQSKQLAVEANFELYKKAHEKSTRISEELTDISLLAQKIPNYNYAHRLNPLVEYLIALDKIDPDREQVILKQQANGLLMMQQFNAATEAYEKINKRDAQAQQRLELCRQYAAIKPNDSKPLGEADLARLLRTHYSTISVQIVRLIYYHDRRSFRLRNPVEHLDVAGAMLTRHNALSTGHTPRLKLSKRPEGWHLDLSQTPYSSYVIEMAAPLPSLNILQPLQLYSLDISHTPVSLVKELKELKIKELRMIGVSLQPIASIVGIKEEMGLERLILGKGEYPGKTIKYIRSKGIEVVEEEYRSQETEVRNQ